jgi:hypothetical protein
VQLEVDDPRRILVHLTPIPQPQTRDNIVTSQKSKFEDQDKTIDYIVIFVVTSLPPEVEKYIQCNSQE